MLKIRRKESTVIDFEIIKKGFEGFYKVYPLLEPKERQVLARLFIKEVKIFNDKIEVKFLEFPELAHQEPVHILKEPSIRGANFYFELNWRDKRKRYFEFLFLKSHHPPPPDQNFVECGLSC